MQPSQVQWHTPSSPVLRRQMQEELCEVKASLIYKASSRPAEDTVRPCLKRKEKRKGKGK